MTYRWIDSAAAEITIGVVAFGALSLLLVASIQVISDRVSFPTMEASIEQLRKDSLGVDPGQAEDVIGQVTSINQMLAKNRACNAIWWCDWSVTDQWDQVRSVPVPRRAQ